LTLTARLDIRAPIESVFATISQPDKQKQWLDGLAEVKWEDSPSSEHPVGSKFIQTRTQKGKSIELECEVMEYYEPHVFSFLVKEQGFPLEITYRLESLSSSTCRLHFRAMISTPSIPTRIAGSLYLWLKMIQVKKELARLKDLVEKETTEQSSSQINKTESS